MASPSIASALRPLSTVSPELKISSPGATLLIIDPGVPDYPTLVATAPPDTEVYRLDGQTDGITQITTILAGRQDIHSLHILCHGSPNRLHFSGGEVGLHNIANYAQALQTWRAALAPEGNILLYGCQVAAAGARSLIDYMAQQTGAQVAASSGPTGSEALGGDWILDVSTGPITARSALQGSALAAYPHLLALTRVSEFSMPTLSSRLQNFLFINNILYFIADDNTNGYGLYGQELWKSDGTESGTVLVKDINPGRLGSQISSVTNVNGTLYFIATNGTHGLELWKSDGTEVGTVLVKDINPGSNGSSANLVNINGILYFQADDGIHGRELWKSDGTEAGTVLVKDINSVSNGSSLADFRVLGYINGSFYFKANDGIHGEELWKSDGTEAGTVLVKDINPGSNSSPFYNITNVDGILYFSTTDPTTGLELWKSDGTEAGTVLVKDIYPGILGSSLGSFTSMNGLLYFTANDGSHGQELWKSDGTEAGTVLVKDSYPGSSSSSLRTFTPINGLLYFIANDSTHGEKLWKSDGTEAGTVLVKAINPGNGFSNLDYLTNINGILYFAAYNDLYGEGLWKSDGTEAGTVLVRNIALRTPVTNVNGTLYFAATDGIHGTELWKSDGTETGTVLVKDILALFPARYYYTSDIRNLTSANGTLYFSADDGTKGSELWKSEGTETGTVLVKDISSKEYGGPSNLTVVGNVAYFIGFDGIHGYELWKTDGTAAGTQLVKDIKPGQNGVAFESLTDVNGTLYFTVFDQRDQIWKSDGTEAGTVLVKQLGRQSVAHTHDVFSDISGITSVKDTLYFTTSNNVAGNHELWKSDGTEAGTDQVKDINLAPVKGPPYLPIDYFPPTYKQGSNPKFLTDVNGTLYFTANDGIHNEELWKSDGTEVGTVLVKDVHGGGLSSIPQNLTSVNGILYFTADDNIHGRELWKSDGTEAGTVLVKDISPVARPSPFSLTDVNGVLYFIANDNTTGYELWKSDGTEAGTVLVKDITPGSQSTIFNKFTNVNGILYFTVKDDIHGEELWKSDGTEAGTVLVKDINPGSNSALNPSVGHFTNVNGILYFTANDGIHGVELWMSDGTENGTVQVMDLNPGADSSNPYDLAVLGQDTLLFFADDGTHGIELWRIGPDRPPVVTPVVTPTAARLTPLASQVLSVTGPGPTHLTATVMAQGATSVLDIAMIVVDDAEGRIDGLLPSEAGYQSAALARATTLMSVLKAGDFAGQFGQRRVPVAPGQFLQLALLQGGTLDDLKRGGAGQMIFATGAANEQGFSAVQYSDPSATGLTMTFTLPGRLSPSITLQLGLDPTPPPLGSQGQGLTAQSELIDLTGLVTPTATLSFQVFREAFFTNEVGLYRVEDTQGRVRDPLTGNLLSPGEVGYQQAALANRVVSNLSGQDGQTLTYSATVATGQLLSTFLVVNGPLDALLDATTANNPTIFFNYIAANADGQDHVRLLGDNTFGFEDILGGGDRDFNDVIVKVVVA